MTTLALYLPAVLLLAGLSFAVMLVILATRSYDLFAQRRSSAFYADFNPSSAPIFVQRPTRQLANLFEFPVLFYALIAMAVGSGIEDSLLAQLALTYAVLRWMHAIIHIAFNNLWIRTPVFAGGNIVLLIMWIRFALISLPGLSG